MALVLVNVRLLKFVESRETVFVSRLFMQKKIKQEKTIVGKNVVLRFLVVGVLFQSFFAENRLHFFLVYDIMKKIRSNAVRQHRFCLGKDAVSLLFSRCFYKLSKWRML